VLQVVCELSQLPRLKKQILEWNEQNQLSTPYKKREMDNWSELQSARNQ
jgi:hypothetical protein